MKSTEDMEKFVADAKPHVTTGASMDKRVLQDSFAAMDEKRRVGLAPPSLIGGLKPTLRFAKLAAAAAIIVAAGLLLTRDRHTPNRLPAPPELAAQTPATMLSMMSLRMAYQRGGWDALDRQFRDTLDQFGPAASRLSMSGRIAGLEGSNGS